MRSERRQGRRFEIFGVKPGSFMVFAFGEGAVPEHRQAGPGRRQGRHGVEIEHRDRRDDQRARPAAASGRGVDRARGRGRAREHVRCGEDDDGPRRCRCAERRVHAAQRAGGRVQARRARDAGAGRQAADRGRRGRSARRRRRARDPRGDRGQGDRHDRRSRSRARRSRRAAPTTTRATA